MREPRWRSEGQEPDYRFTLANERTFLAWLRTALSLLAAGVLLVQFATRFGMLSAAMAVAGCTCSCPGPPGAHFFSAMLGIASGQLSSTKISVPAMRQLSRFQDDRRH